MKNKVLIGVGSYNAPHFLQHLVDSFSRHNPGYDCDFYIVDNESSDEKTLKLLEKYSKKYFVYSRPNEGRAQGVYDFLWQNNKDYKYYFFMHDDSAFIRDNWLKIAVDRIEDNSLENSIKEIKLVDTLPVGKVGFQTYEWGDKYKYLRTGYPQIFRYMDWIEPILDMKIPEYYQHINDDKYLIKNELLQKMGKIWNVGEWKKLELQNDERWNKINNWFENNLPNFVPLRPYDGRYNGFQTCSEFLSTIAPMRYGYRTHCVINDGYCQETAGWSSFRGNEYIVHYGDHVVFKRLSILLNTPEEIIRKKYKESTFLQICDNIIKRETKYVEKR